MFIAIGRWLMNWCPILAGLACISGTMILDDRPDFSIVAEPAVINLGTLELDSEYTCTFVLKNCGRLSAHIDKVWTRCGCTGATASNERIDVGQATRVSTTVKTSKTEEVSIRRYVFVQISAKRSEVLAVRVEYFSKYKSGRSVVPE
jgi:archaellum component FlaG (FlaF/FlaG flagellin family)